MDVEVAQAVVVRVRHNQLGPISTKAQASRLVQLPNCGAKPSTQSSCGCPGGTAALKQLNRSTVAASASVTGAP